RLMRPAARTRRRELGDEILLAGEDEDVRIRGVLVTRDAPVRSPSDARHRRCPSYAERPGVVACVVHERERGLGASAGRDWQGDPEAAGTRRPASLEFFSEPAERAPGLRKAQRRWRSDLERTPSRRRLR